MIMIPANQILTGDWTVDTPLRQDKEGVLLALPAESKLFLVVFIDRYGG